MDFKGVEVDYISNIKNLSPDTKLVEGSDITIGDIRNSKEFNKTRFRSVHVEWDNSLQATSFGAAILINPDILLDKDLEENYLSREGSPEDLFMNKYNIPKEAIYTKLNEEYEKIIRISPVLDNIKNFFMWSHVWKNIHLHFRNKFQANALYKDLIDVIGGENGSILFFHFDGFDENILKHDEDVDFIFGRDGRRFYNKFSLKDQKMDMVYLTSLMDSGFDIDFISKYSATAAFNVSGKPSAASNSKIYFYMEKFYHAN